MARYPPFLYECVGETYNLHLAAPGFGQPSLPGPRSQHRISAAADKDDPKRGVALGVAA